MSTSRRREAVPPRRVLERLLADGRPEAGHGVPDGASSPASRRPAISPCAERVAPVLDAQRAAGDRVDGLARRRPRRTRRSSVVRRPASRRWRAPSALMRSPASRRGPARGATPSGLERRRRPRAGRIELDRRRAAARRRGRRASRRCARRRLGRAASACGTSSMPVSVTSRAAHGQGGGRLAADEARADDGDATRAGSRERERLARRARTAGRARPRRSAPARRRWRARSRRSEPRGRRRAGRTRPSASSRRAAVDELDARPGRARSSSDVLAAQELLGQRRAVVGPAVVVGDHDDRRPRRPPRGTPRPPRGPAGSAADDRRPSPALEAVEDVPVVRLRGRDAHERRPRPQLVVDLVARQLVRAAAAPVDGEQRRRARGIRASSASSSRVQLVAREVVEDLGADDEVEAPLGQVLGRAAEADVDVADRGQRGARGALDRGRRRLQRDQPAAAAREPLASARRSTRRARAPNGYVRSPSAAIVASYLACSYSEPSKSQGSSDARYWRLELLDRVPHASSSARPARATSGSSRCCSRKTSRSRLARSSASPVASGPRAAGADRLVEQRAAGGGDRVAQVGRERRRRRLRARRLRHPQVDRRHVRCACGPPRARRGR